MDEAFYDAGLRFSCERCSYCCRGERGYIFLSPDDLRRLLHRFALDFKSFFRDYCTLVDAGSGMALSLRDVERGAGPAGPGLSYDCVFWGEGGCAVYEDRPVQCSTYPFWASIMESEASWRDEARSCPGIGAGELRSRSHIEECISARRRAGMVVLAYGVDPERADEDSILGGSGLGSDAPDAVEGQE
jgi:uncharacterized protein